MNAICAKGIPTLPPRDSWSLIAMGHWTGLPETVRPLLYLYQVRSSFTCDPRRPLSERAIIETVWDMSLRLHPILLAPRRFTSVPST